MTHSPVSIEIVISVHDPQRPLERAIRSVLDTHSQHRVSVLVVEHNCADGAFDSVRLALEGEPVRWLRFRDGIKSPAGPFNFGISQSTGDYVGLLGSDDRFESGAVDSLLRRLDETRPDVLVYPLRHDGQPSLPNPLARKWRTRNLHVVRDRLMYRTAPLALVRQGIWLSSDYAFTEGLPTGEDVSVSAALWFSEARIDFHPRDPGYVIMNDGPQRVTLEVRPLHEEFRPFLRLFSLTWVQQLGTEERLALVVKTVRVHVLGALFRRLADGSWSEKDRTAVQRILAVAEALSPRYLEVLSRADGRLLRDVQEPITTFEDFEIKVRRRNEAGRSDRWLTADLRLVLHRESPLRRLIRYATWP
ncbi:glycosyltransferase family A protein [Microbacterium sp. OR21]|uniref:glycosyltransferase family A protein n=1 Tax=Microbacterium sp. OR21 TaxID=3095346 RepID=UPI0039B51472